MITMATETALTAQQTWPGTTADRLRWNVSVKLYMDRATPIMPMRLPRYFGGNRDALANNMH